MKESKLKVAKGQFMVEDKYNLAEVISQQMYYELFNKILSDLREIIQQLVKEFYDSGNQVMTMEDRNELMKKVKGD